MKLSQCNGNSLRYGMLIPFVFLIASVVSCCLSYYDAKRDIADDLNEATVSLAGSHGELWICPDTIAALRQIYETTHNPVIFQASDIKFRNKVLKDDAYFTLALIDRTATFDSNRIRGHKIVSDSIRLLPESAADGVAIQLQGFVDCSFASVFAVSDQSLTGMLFTLAFFSMTILFFWSRGGNCQYECEQCGTVDVRHRLEAIKLTPMQRQFTQLFLDAPNLRVDKKTLCNALWGNKSNAEESLYTLVRRTKIALSDADIEIVCNRGESYELRVID